MYSKENLESTVSIKLSSCNLIKDRYVARVPRNTVKLNEIITEISENYPSLDPYVIAHSAELLKHSMLKQLKAGRAVNVLELGTMYPAPTGTVTNSNPQMEDMPSLTLKFTPSKEALSSLGSISVDSFMISDNKPQIQTICSLKDGNTDGILHRGFGVKITGAKLKLAGKDSGIFFIPAGEEGKAVNDESLWISVDASYLPQNKQKEVQFNLPESLQSDIPYYIGIRTAYLSANTSRKNSVLGISSITVRLTA